jgi:hypothetical protein
MKNYSLFYKLCINSLLGCCTIHLGFSAGPAVTVDPVPAATYGVSTVFNGTLTRVANQVAQLEQNKQGDQIGRCTTTMGPVVTGAPGKEEDCCINSTTSGKKWVIKPLNITVDWKIPKVEVFLPVWSIYSSQCASAKIEWDRWRGVVKAHEDGHRTVVVDFVKKSAIEPYYTGASLDFESSCVEASQIQTARDSAINNYRNAMNAIANQIFADYETADDQYHQSSPYSIIDTSKECP